MYVYSVSPIVQYSPFFKLTYFSYEDFEVGSVLEISFNRKIVNAVVIEKEDLIKAKIELRKADFKTKKIENQTPKKIIPKNILEKFKNISQKLFLPLGEILFYLYDEDFLNFDLERLFQNKTKNKIQASEIPFVGKINLYREIFESKNGSKKFIIFSDEINLLNFKKRFADKLKSDKSVVPLKPKDFIKKIHKFSEAGCEIYIDNFSFEDFYLMQKPHINQLDLLVFILENYDLNFSKILFLSEAFGISEYKYFKDNKINFNFVESENKTKKYFVNLDKASNEYKTLKKEIITKEILEKIEESVRNHKKVFIFVLNHGCVQRLYCNSCNTAVACENCDGVYTLHYTESGNMLFCKACKNYRYLYENQLLLCKKCGGFDFEQWGLGIHRVYEYLKEKVESEILELDESLSKIKDTELIKKVRNIFGEKLSGGIIVGSLRSLKALPDQADLSVVLSLGDLESDNFNSNEIHRKWLRQIENKSRELYFQKIVDSRDSEEDKKLKNKNNFFQNYKDENFLEVETDRRIKQNLPPFKKVLTLTYLAKNKKEILKIVGFLEKAGEYKKGKFLVTYFFVDLYDKNMNLENFEKIIEFARSVAEVSFGDSVKDFVLK